MLVSIVDCDKTLLALELVVDLSPMLDAIAEPIALLDSLEEGWEVSSADLDFAEAVDDDSMPGLSKNDWITWRFISCLQGSLPAWDFSKSATMLDSLNTFLHNLHLSLVSSGASANQSLYSSWSSQLF